MELTKFGQFLVNLFGIVDVDDYSHKEKAKMNIELYLKTGLTMRQLDNMSVKEVLNFKRK
jgi:hypothetical protein